MNVAERFIRLPVVTILVMLGILLLGVTGYLFLPAVKPQNLDSPTILVYANLPGASAAIIESSMATPLERQLVTLAGWDAMTSVNDVGFTDIALEFNANRNVDTVAQDVQEAINRTLPQLPSGMPKPPSCRKLKVYGLLQESHTYLHISVTGYDVIAVQNTRPSFYRFLIFRAARDLLLLKPNLAWGLPSKLLEARRALRQLYVLIKICNHGY